MTTLETISPQSKDSAAAESRDELKQGASPVWVSTKICDSHRERLAVVYVRQSTPQQAVEHRESLARQYALKDHAVTLGWAPERVVVIDEDLGLSGRSAEGRHGFQRLLTEIAMNHVGIVLGLEMSRLARSGKDWHHLLELCGVFGTLLADQDGVYDPNEPNDRLLLGLRGTISEVELHTMRNRLYRGKLNKAQRGELFSHPPAGYVRLPSGPLALDPDEQVQAVVRLIFDKFTELKNVYAVLRYLVKHDLRLGIRPHKGNHRGVLQWRRPCRSTLLNILRHPLYAGAYCYGRRPSDSKRKVPGRPGSGRILASPEQYLVLLPDRCPAYITWERHQENLRCLAENRARAESRGAPRQGAGLLSGLLVCGRCGSRMRVSYPGKDVHPRYTCDRAAMHCADPVCQSISGRVLDKLVAHQVLAALVPASLELSLVAVANQEEERRRLEKHWRQRLERASYEAERAARQYDVVEPENRLVARTLEQRWEQALLEQRKMQEDHDRFQCEQPAELTPQDRESIRTLASDIPALWQAPSTRAEDRKTILRHLIERVTITVHGTTEVADVSIQWSGGFISRYELVRPVFAFEQLRDYEGLFARIVELRKSGWTAPEIAEQLNTEGWRGPRRQCKFNEFMVRNFLSRRGLATSRPKDPSAAQHLGSHEWWFADLAIEVGMSSKTLYHWIQRGWVHARQLRGAQGRWIPWADDEELDRLKRLRNRPRGGNNNATPASLSTPKPRPES